MNCRTYFPAFPSALPSTTAIGPTAVLKCGDSAKVLKSILANSVSAVICDPPFGIDYGGKDWDDALPDDAIWRECFRVSSHHAPISRPLWALMIASHGRVACRRILKGRERRRLNSLFVGWLMGWPIGHALCACSATDFTLWRQQMRGALSQLPMASGPWIWRPTDGATRPVQMTLFEGLQP